MNTMLLLVVLLVCCFVIVLALLIFLLVRNNENRKNKEKQAYIDKESYLVEGLRNHYITGESKKEKVTQVIAEKKSSMLLSYCLTGRIENKVIKSNEHINVGRADYNYIKIDDLTVSSKHCEIYSIANQFYVRDLYSRNKTRIQRGGHMAVVDSANGMALVTGDKILVGNIELWVTIN